MTAPTLTPLTWDAAEGRTVYHYGYTGTLRTTADPGRAEIVSCAGRPFASIDKAHAAPYVNAYGEIAVLDQE